MEAPVFDTPAPRRAILPVILGGLVTTALTLVGVWYLSRVSDQANIMGWYADYVIPVGPILVGIVAGCGYGIMSYRTGVKVSGKLLWLVLLLQLLAYFAAQYIEFERFVHMVRGVVRVDGVKVNFWHWFDLMSRSFAWVEQNGKPSHGDALGAWGYGIRALEILGFSLGGLIVPAIMRTLPYCDGCGVYMKTRQLLVLPAGLKPRRVKKGDTAGQEAWQAELQAAFDAGAQQLEHVRELVKDGKVSDLQRLIEANKAEAKAAASVSTRIVCSLVQCPLCRTGYLKSEAWSGQGNTQNNVDLGRTEAARGLEL